MAAIGSIAVVAVVPTVATIAAGQVAVGEILGDHFGERVGAHGVFGVERNEPQVVAAEAGEQRALVDRAMRVRRHIDARRARFALQAAARQRIIRRPLARADERDQRAGRGGVLDHAAPGGREAEHLPQPIGDDFLDFRHRRARLPREPDHAEPGADDDRRECPRAGRWRGNSRRSADAAKATSPGTTSRFEILDHRAEVFRLVRRRGGQGVADLAGPGFGHHRPVGQALVVVGQPIDELMAIAAEFFRRHERPCRFGAVVRGSSLHHRSEG